MIPSKDTSWWDHIEGFKPEEFDSPDAHGTGLLMNKRLIVILDECRTQTRRKFRKFKVPVTSGYRTTARNQKVGGISTSRHLTGEAADVGMFNSAYQREFIKHLLDYDGLTIGIYEGHLHVELDPIGSLSYLYYGKGA